MTNDILLHVRGYRQLTIGRIDRIATSLPEHMAIIDALEQRDTDLAERRRGTTPSALRPMSKRTARNCSSGPILTYRSFLSRCANNQGTNSSSLKNDQGEAECPQ